VGDGVSVTRPPPSYYTIEKQIELTDAVAKRRSLLAGADRIVTRRIVPEINITIITNRVAVDEVGSPDTVFERALWRM
jgi:hypothetical protein